VDSFREKADLTTQPCQVRLCFRVRPHRYMVRMGDATTWQNLGAGHSDGRKNTPG
jgi:hypothetical protein